MFVSRSRESHACGVVKFCHRIIRWNFRSAVSFAANKRFLTQPASLIDFKHVDGQVFGPNAQNLLDRFLPRFPRLVRQPGNQIQADIAEADLAKNRGSGKNIRAAVHSPSGLQLRVAERLRA